MQIDRARAQLATDLRLARLRAGYSQDGLAYLAGVSVRTVIRAEQGCGISLRSAFLILSALFGPDEPLTLLAHYAERRD